MDIFGLRHQLEDANKPVPLTPDQRRAHSSKTKNIPSEANVERGATHLSDEPITSQELRDAMHIGTSTAQAVMAALVERGIAKQLKNGPRGTKRYVLSSTVVDESA